jgi:putative two-component system response regulator
LFQFVDYSVPVFNTDIRTAKPFFTGNNMKILIAEDDPVSRAKLEKIVETIGHSPVSAPNGKEALKQWENSRPAMLITDWCMPEMDGLELIKEIRRRQGSRYVFIIMVTSQDSTDNLVTGIEAGADDFITKPFSKDELAVRIKAGERILNFETRDIVIFSMANLAEARDSETGNHLNRIRSYSKILAETIMASENRPGEMVPHFIDNIMLTSPLHDIGKIGIPDFVLLKPGRLDDREFDIMKSHSTIGWQALSNALHKYPNADYLRMSADIALCHHEKFDGSGYPNGKKGEEIPLAARIVALADVYDALVSKRVYKSAFPHEVSRSIILKERGKHFDPVVIDAFEKCEGEFCKVLKENLPENKS